MFFLHILKTIEIKTTPDFCSMKEKIPTDYQKPIKIVSNILYTCKSINYAGVINMKPSHGLILKRQLILFGAVAIALLFISSATLVPQAQGAAVNNQIDTINEHNTLADMIKSLQIDETSTEQQRLQAAYVMLSLVDTLISTPALLDFPIDELTLKETASTLMQKTVTETDLQEKTDETIHSLKTTLTEGTAADYTPEQVGLITNLLRTLLNKLISRIINIDLSIGDGSKGILRNILGMFSGLPSMLLKLFGQGLSMIIQSVVRVIRAILSILVLFISGIQLALLLGGLFFIFLGVASKFGMRAFSIIGAPLFGIIGLMMTLSMGNLIGGTSMIINSAIGFVITFAIPIAIIIAVILLLTGGDINIDPENLDFGAKEGGLVYMIGSILTNYIDQITG